MSDIERALEEERRIINAATEEMDMSETSEQVHETQDVAPSFRQKLARMSLDDRVMAWAAICDHPIFDGAHETHEGLLDGMVSKLNYAHRGNTALPLRSAQVEAVLALHQREVRWQIDSYPELSFETFADAEDMADGPDEQFSNFELCVECKRIEDGPSGVNSKDVGYESALYPCPTVRAIEEAGA